MTAIAVRRAYLQVVATSSRVCCSYPRKAKICQLLTTVGIGLLADSQTGWHCKSLGGGRATKRHASRLLSRSGSDKYTLLVHQLFNGTAASPGMLRVLGYNP